MRPQRLLRAAAAGGLVAAGWLLARAARGVRQAAETVSPDDHGTTGAATRQPAAPARVPAPPAAVRIPDAPAHARAPETHVEELAAKPAADVIAAVDGLSTDELGRLYEYEQTHKQRKTVLQAIEKALTPTT